MIALENVSKKYLNGETSYEALKNIDIKINPGEKVAITGPSGAGKSTLLNIMSTLDRPTSGSVLFDDKHLEGLGEDETARIRLTEFGFIFQDYMLMPTLNIWDNICLPVILSGEKVNNERISTYIEKLLPECDARSMPHQFLKKQWIGLYCIHKSIISIVFVFGYKCINASPHLLFFIGIQIDLRQSVNIRFEFGIIIIRVKHKTTSLFILIVSYTAMK